MNERAVATRAVLQALDQSERIDSLDDRTRIQKLVYLAQQAGIPLGYYFSWYLRGPYSSTLARDYYNMPAAELGGKLRPDLLPLLQRVSAVLGDHRKPPNASVADWLEAVASVHYLNRVSNLDTNATDEKLKREKPRIFDFVPAARQVVDEYFPIKTKADQ